MPPCLYRSMAPSTHQTPQHNRGRVLQATGVALRYCVPCGLLVTLMKQHQMHGAKLTTMIGHASPTAPLLLKGGTTVHCHCHRLSDQLGLTD
jgi:hypothetical protein